MSRVDRDATPAALVAAEVGLLCAGIGTVLGFSRLFVGWSYVGPLAITVVTSWALSVATRRLGWGVGWSGALSTVAGLLAAAWIFAPGTTAFGLPTPSTLDVIAREIRLAFSDISSMVAPVDASTGFLVVLAVVLWVFTFFADTAAFRYQGPVQAVIPYASAFVAAGILARDAGRTGSALAFLAGLGIYAVTQRALLVSERRWMRGDAVRGTWAVTGAATIGVVVALAVGVIASPWLPGSTDAVVDLRSLGREGGARTVVSPFVGVRNLLGEQSDQIVFTGRGSAPAYWRLTALSGYDPSRDIWVSRGSYVSSDGGELATPRRGVPTVEVLQDVEIASLGGPWLPAAFEPASIDIDTEISFDRVTSSIITGGDSLDVGTRYDVTSLVPVPTPDALHGSFGDDSVDAVYVDDSAVSPDVARTARRIVMGAPDDYSRMLALQDWFREDFIYDTEVDYRSDADPVAAFLRARRGFCQQFASTFALMARSLGVPARVAVGFTQGDAAATGAATATGAPGDAAMTGYVVRGRHAHTWPEVYLDGVGWVPFEPTTGRGNPQAESYTGIEAQQAPPPEEQATTTTAPTTTAPSDQQSSTTLAPGQLDTVAPDDPEADRRTGPISWSVLGLAAAAIFSVLAVVFVLRRRRHPRSGDPVAGRVQDAWQRTMVDLAALGITVRSSETPFEAAGRVAASDAFSALDSTALDATPVDGENDAVRRQDVVDAMEVLASCESERRFGRRGIDDARAADAQRAAATVHAAARTVASSRQRLRQLIG